MPRRYITVLLAAALLAALTVQATDFWLTKDWRQWSKDECARILVESPWAHVWRGQLQTQAPISQPPRTQQNTNPAPLLNSPAQNPPVPANPAEDGYAVQLRSALPIREAIVRQLEIAQQYNQKTDAQRKAFDAAAGQILNTSYDKTILVRLYSSKDNPGLRSQQVKNLQAMIVTEDGQQITPTQVDADPMTPDAIDLYFPRLINGAPAVKDGHKQFSFQFQTPQYLDTKGVNVMPRRVTINFDLSKMLVEGKLTY
jgi:hypothetical protein